MAIVIIKVQDMPDGRTDVQLIADPIVTGEETEFTIAQKMGAVALTAIDSALRKESPILMDGGSKKIFLPN